MCLTSSFLLNKAGGEAYTAKCPVEPIVTDAGDIATLKNMSARQNMIIFVK